MPAVFSLRTQRWLLAGVALVIVLWFLYSAQTALFPFMLGTVLAYVLLPLVNGLERMLPWPPRPAQRRPLAILVVYLTGIATVGLSVAFLVPVLNQEFDHLLERLPFYVETIQTSLEGWTSQYREAVPEEVQLWVDQQIQRVVVQLQDVGQSLALNVLSMVSSTVGTVIGLFIIPVWLFFVLKDQPRAMPAFYGVFPPPLQPVVRDIIFIVDRILGKYIRTQLLLGLIVGCVTLVGLTLIGIPFAPVLAVIGGIGELIPIIGPILGAIPAIVVTLATDPSKTLVVVLLYWGIQFFENNLLVPRMQGDAVQLPPPIIMILLVGAGEAAGVWGMLAIVPLAAILRDIYVYLYRRVGGHLPPTVTEQALEAHRKAETTRLIGEEGLSIPAVRTAEDQRSEEGVTVPPGS